MGSAETQELTEGDERGGLRAAAVDVKFGLRGGVAQPCEGFDGEVETLVPLEAAGEENDESAVVTGPGAGIEDGRVDVIQENRALSRRDGAPDQLLVPQVVRDDDVVGKGRREPLHPGQQADTPVRQRDVELAGIELRHDVVNVENDPGARPLRIKSGKDQEIRHVVHMDDVVGVAAMAPGPATS